MTTGQQVKGGVATHGVKGEGVHGTRVTRHVTHLVLSVGRHRDKYSGGLDDVSQNFYAVSSSSSGASAELETD